MADAFSSVSPEVDARKKALLEAVATGGTRGLQAFEQAEKAIGEQRQAALGRAGARAALVGGPEAQGFETMAENQFGSRLADLSRGRAGFEEDIARRGIAGQSALEQLRAIAPLMQAKTTRDIALKREDAMTAARKAAKDESQKNWEARALGQAEIEEQARQTNLKTAEGNLASVEKASDLSRFDNAIKQEQAALTATEKRIAQIDKLTSPGSLGAGPRRFMSILPGGERALWGPKEIQQLKNEYESQKARRDAAQRTIARLNQERETARIQGEPRLAEARGVLERTQGEALGLPLSDRAREIAIQQLGIDPALATGKLGAEDIPTRRLPQLPAAQKALIREAHLSEEDFAEVQKDKDYIETEELLNGIVGVWSKEQAMRFINLLPAHKTRTKALLRAQFDDQFQSSAALKKATQ